MYNEAIKREFIGFYTGNLSTAKVAETLFNATEEHELAWGADLSTKSAEELQPMVDKLLGLRTRSHWMYVTILREYVKWCVALEKVDGACNGMADIKSQGLGKMQHQMVANPMHLQRVLDETFDPDIKETVDDICRCYLWLAFAGLDEDEVFTLKRDDIDLQKMLVSYNVTIYGKNGEEHIRRSVPIYREAERAFKNVRDLTTFFYANKGYRAKSIRRDRVEGDEFLRGFRSVMSKTVVRSRVVKISERSIQEGKTEFKLSFKRVQMSGLFYRVYERERAGVPVSFEEAVDLYIAKNHPEYDYTSQEGIRLINERKRTLARWYKNDYERWKLAFSV